MNQTTINRQTLDKPAIRPDVPAWTFSSTIVVAGITLFACGFLGPLGLLVGLGVGLLVLDSNRSNAIMISQDYDETALPVKEEPRI